MRVLALLYAPHHIEEFLYFLDSNPGTSGLFIFAKTRQQDFGSGLEQNRFAPPIPGQRITVVPYFFLKTLGSILANPFLGAFRRLFLRTIDFLVTAAPQEDVARLVRKMPGAPGVIVLDDGLSSVFLARSDAQDSSNFRFFSKYSSLFPDNVSLAPRERQSWNLPRQIDKDLLGVIGSPIVEYGVVTATELINLLNQARLVLHLQHVEYVPHRRENWYRSTAVPDWLQVATGSGSFKSWLLESSTRPKHISNFFSSAILDVRFESNFPIDQLSFISLNHLHDRTQMNIGEAFINFEKIMELFEELQLRKLEHG